MLFCFYRIEFDPFVGLAHFLGRYSGRRSICFISRGNTVFSSWADAPVGVEHLVYASSVQTLAVTCALKCW